MITAAVAYRAVFVLLTLLFINAPPAKCRFVAPLNAESVKVRQLS